MATTSTDASVKRRGSSAAKSRAASVGTRAAGRTAGRGARAASSSAATPAVTKAQVAFEKTQQAVVAEREKKKELRVRLAAAQDKARASGRAVDRNAAKRAVDAVAKSNEKLRTLRSTEADAKLALIAAKAESALVNHDAVVQDKVASRAAALAQRTEQDLVKALATFEAKWRKQRAAADARKLKKAETRERAKAKAAAQKQQQKLRKHEARAAGTTAVRGRRRAVSPADDASPVKRRVGRPRKNVA